MNNFKALTVAGLLVGSVSANAAVLTMPATASFDIRGTTLNDFILGGSFTKNQYEWTNIEQSSFTGPNAGSDGTGRQYGLTGERHSTYNEGVTDPNLAFWQSLFGTFVTSDTYDLDIAQSMSRLELGTQYDFFMGTYVYEFVGEECRVADPAEECYQTMEGSNPKGRTTITFFDSMMTTDVPVGPTAPLLAAGLVGLWLRRKG